MSEIEWAVTQGVIDIEQQFGEPQEMLAHLLINDVAFLNSYWFEKEWPAEAQTGISVNVICSDTFGYACADCERLPYEQIATLYWIWRKDPVWGPTAWCVARRKEKPIGPVVRGLVERGYDVDALLRGEMPDATSQPRPAREGK